MIKLLPKPHVPAPFGSRRRTRFLRVVSVVSGVVGSALGFASNLYSDQFREAIASTAGWFSAPVISVVIAAVMAGGSTMLVYRLIVHRTRPPETAERKFKIGSDALKYVVHEPNAVVGRYLHYLETRRDTGEIVVFLHGLGLDAGDFAPYMAESRFHCVALTQFGFNAAEREDAGYKPIALEAHVQLIVYTLSRLKKTYPDKQITIVGFSFGADMLLFMKMFANGHAGSLGIKKVLLLDPNINATTTVISSHIAGVGVAGLLDELAEILKAARDVSEFRYLAEYLYKITAKNFAHIRRHAGDVVTQWNSSGYEEFLDRVGQLQGLVDDVHIILSRNSESHFNAMARAAQRRGFDISSLDCSQCDHFDLIKAKLLKERLEGLLELT